MDSHCAYWVVIDALSESLASGEVNRDRFKEARLRLSLEFDKRVINKLPTDELKRLQGVLDYLEYDITLYE